MVTFASNNFALNIDNWMSRKEQVLVAFWIRVGSLTSWSRKCSLNVSRRKLNFDDSVAYSLSGAAIPLYIR